MAEHYVDIDDDTADENPRQQKRATSILHNIAELIIALLIAVTLSWTIKTFMIEPYEVPTGSMEPTIMIGDKILAEKLSLRFNSVRSGDIIVFADKTVLGRVLVKRVIATGGQVVDIRDGLVYVDGSPLYEPYTHGVPSFPLEQHFENMSITYPYKVPEGFLWVMGDNRGKSADSRYFGPISEDSIYGRAVMIFFPWEDIGPL